jgi:hypothetical protein
MFICEAIVPALQPVVIMFGAVSKQILLPIYEKPKKNLIDTAYSAVKLRNICRMQF